MLGLDYLVLPSCLIRLARNEFHWMELNSVLSAFYWVAFDLPSFRVARTTSTLIGSNRSKRVHFVELFFFHFSLVATRRFDLHPISSQRSHEFH